MRLLLGALSLVLLVSAAPAVAGEASSPGVPAAASAPEVGRKAFPVLRVRQPVTGLENPWDVQALGGGRLLITERDRARLLLDEDDDTRPVQFPSGRVWVSGETGLMSMEVDPRFADNGRFYTCQGWEKSGGGHDIRVIAWSLNDAGTRARRLETLLPGLPTTSGRHGGCRLLIAGNGALVVGTGDAARGTNPRNLKSLGGKTLRLNRMTGKPWPGNKWARSDSKRKRYVHTFGHRNIQGLAQRADGSLWSVEHGSFRDDEVNKLRKGGDYGWHPVPGYNETVPMTDRSLPGKQYGARWRSGNPTVATSGAAWIKGDKWGRYEGALAVACLKASKVLIMKFNKTGQLKWVRTPAKLRDYGRLRSVSLAPNNDLLITSDNDSGDRILRVSPR